MVPEAHTPARPRSRNRLGSVRRSLFGTRPGQFLIAGAIVKTLTWLLRNAAGVNSTLLDAIGALGSVGVVVGVIYFAYRLTIRAKRRLLWRVRRKLILSYVFVGVVPVLLVVAFFVLGGLLLCFNVAAYLVASDIRAITDDASLLARSAASELTKAPADARQILERKRASMSDRYPSTSLAIVPTSPAYCGGERTAAAAPAAGVERAGASTSNVRQPAGQAPVRVPRLEPMTVGPWAHTPPPQTLPAWVKCTGFAGNLAIAVPTGTGGAATELGLVIRAVELPTPFAPSYAVIVDVPIDGALAARIREETKVKLGPIKPVPTGGDVGNPIAQVGSGASLLLKRPVESGQAKTRIPWFTLLDWRDWQTGTIEKAMLSIEVNIADTYERISAEQAKLGARTFGSLWLLVLALLALLFVIIEVVALIIGLVLARSITGSVHELSIGTRRVREGDFSHKIKIRTRDQMGELATSFNQMTASIEDLLRQAEEKKRLEEELRIARAIQMSLLPRGQLAVPGLSITALCVPAREVGGDYYDLLPLEGNRLGVLIADVSGKGTSAAFYMAELKGLMLSLSRIYHSPRQLLIEANRIIADNLDSRSFITMTYAVVDLGAATMTYARAGHTPLIYRAADSGDGAAVTVLTPDGLVLGLQLDDSAALFERLLCEETIHLRQGDLFMFFTDGISEAMNGNSDCFGESRLSELLAEHGDLPSEELRERILREIDAFVAGAPQHDDMTMILLKVVGPLPLGVSAAPPAPRFAHA
ncbi:MAG: PP2C family protein-serine/threonine phosphatase [Bacteroidales bacterium]